jgi:hypothetical protein
VVVRVGVGLGVKPRLFDSFEQAAAHIDMISQPIPKWKEVFRTERDT